MNNAFSSSPRELLASAWRNRNLILTLSRRDVAGRYRGSFMGILWSFFNPLFMLTVYTFVFGVIFKTRWQKGNDSQAEFAVILFAGMLVFNMFAECVNRAPGLMVANANYVKKVIFPLEILPWVTVGSALFHTAVSFCVWLAFYLTVFGLPPMTCLLLPLVLLPPVLLTIGASWLLSSLGVYLRDIAQMVSIVVSVLMFLAPLFYPASAVPEQYRGLLRLNPLTLGIEQVREILIWGQVPDWVAFGLYMTLSVIVAWLGFAWFQKTRKGFADVL